MLFVGKEIHLLLLVFAVYGFLSKGFSWTLIWLPNFSDVMRATAAGFIFNAPRLISRRTVDRRTGLSVWWL
jgi:hypothetical protein